MSAERIFLITLIANLLGFGGLGSLPVLRGQLAAAGVHADALLLQALAVGNLGPGPNGLYVVAAGYFLDGGNGAAAATCAVLLPPILVLGIERLRNRLLHHRRFRAALQSLSLAVVALLATSSGSLAIHAGTDPLGVVMIAIGTIMLLAGWPPLLGIAVAVGAGLLA